MAACAPRGNRRTVVVLRTEGRRSCDRVRGEVGGRDASNATGKDDKGGEHSAQAHVGSKQEKMFVGLFVSGNTTLKGFQRQLYMTEECQALLTG
jgi:hypothetical protein